MKKTGFLAVVLFVCVAFTSCGKLDITGSWINDELIMKTDLYETADAQNELAKPAASIFTKSKMEYIFFQDGTFKRFTDQSLDHVELFTDQITKEFLESQVESVSYIAEGSYALQGSSLFLEIKYVYDEKGTQYTYAEAFGADAENTAQATVSKVNGNLYIDEVKLTKK